MNNSITAESGETVDTFPYFFLFLGTVIHIVTLIYIYFKITLNKVIKGKMIKLLMHFELKVNNDFLYDQMYRYLNIHAHPKCGGVSHDVYLTHCHEAFNHGLLLVCYWLFGWHGCE